MLNSTTTAGGRAAANQRAFPSSAEPTRRQPKTSPRLTRLSAAVGTGESGTQRKRIILRLQQEKGGILYLSMAFGADIV